MEKISSLASEKKVAVLYLFGMGFYILLSNLILSLFVQNQALLNTLKNANSWILVLSTTAIFYIVVKSLYQQDPEIRDASDQSKEIKKSAYNHADKIQELLIQILRKASSPMAILKGENHTYLFVNDAYLKMPGHTKSVGETVKQTFPEAKEQALIDMLDKVYKSGKPIFVKKEPLKVNQLGERETFDQDFIYHPLTNNKLIVIAGLLELQAENFQNREKKQDLKSTQTHIYTIADIHEALTHKTCINQIPISDFIPGIPERTFAFFDQNTPAVKICTEKESIDINQAVPLGLLLNEFFTFLAQQHVQDLNELTVLTDSSQAPAMTIKIKVHSLNPELVQSFKSFKGFRNTLVSLLLDQLDATLKISISNKSSEINFHFMKKDKSGPYGNNSDRTRSNQPMAH